MFAIVEAVIFSLSKNLAPGIMMANSIAAPISIDLARSLVIGTLK